MEIQREVSHEAELHIMRSIFSAASIYRALGLEVFAMKITESLLKEMENVENFSDGIILPDGDYRLIDKGHLHSLMALLPYPEEQIWKMIPGDDSPLFWLVEKTGCVLTDYNSTVGMDMTPAQKEVFDALVQHGIITEEYFNLTKQRQKAREKRSGKVGEN